MNKIYIDILEIKIVVYYMIMFPFQLIERLFPFMDSTLKVLQIIVFVLCILEIVIKRMPLFTTWEIPMILFTLWGGVSTCIQSPDEIFYYIHWTIFPFISMIAFSKCIYCEGFDKAARCISRLYIIAIWINFILMLFFPEGVIYSNIGAVTYRANWLFGSKNNIVAELPYILMFLFYDMYLKKNEGKSITGRYLTIVIMLISFSSMGSERRELMAGSTTGIIAILFFMFMYGVSKFYYLRKIRKILTIKFITIISLVLMLLVVAISQGQFRIIDDILLWLGKDRTFSGRSYVWSEAIASIWKYPILGIGSEQKVFHIYGFSNSMNTGLYSFWISVFVRYGIVGVLLTIVMFFSIKFETTTEETGGFYISLAFFLMMIGGLSNPTPWKTVVFMMMSLILYHREKTIYV